MGEICGQYSIADMGSRDSLVERIITSVSLRVPAPIASVSSSLWRVVVFCFFPTEVSGIPNLN